MSTEQFDYIQAEIEHLIYKLNTNWQCSISTEEKIAICNICHYIKLNHSRPVSLQCVWLTSQPANQKSTENCLSSVR